MTTANDLYEQIQNLAAQCSDCIKADDDPFQILQDKNDQLVTLCGQLVRENKRLWMCIIAFNESNRGSAEPEPENEVSARFITSPIIKDLS